MKNITDADVRDFVKGELPLATTLFKKIDIEDSAPLQALHEADDIAEMTENFFERFNVQPAGFFLGNYYPWKSKPLFSRKQPNEDKKPLTIIMYIESAKAGRWLYD
ncbi:uncharacterized protein DUF1493 [Gibbsiella quercinecans]|uniref:Cytoplasmic protein n=1 Tax=Gibbsiella quercinecans TaxID=929813 RepID=A0A250B4T3_9GAMM|nr:DUF1493 family protein [Gibbsiella quercinecans]ATA21105.1 hypothetical protein AWC35_18105 [Gibbsiella quercinecans]RLM08476.1 hypothetical protein BIY31_11800 [Gibbsiella quercinecans]RLM11751.1 hypothetical protein BIY30_08240 [Gibbsiella quercinecans]TCT86710.1 uncharacterized protein DUF1493 [Gibbsiella quercinecans]